MPAPCCASRDWLISREPFSVTVPSESQQWHFLPSSETLLGSSQHFPPPSQKQVAPGASGIIIPSFNHGKNGLRDAESSFDLFPKFKMRSRCHTIEVIYIVLVTVFWWDSGQWCCWVGYLCFYCMEYNICCSCVEYLFCLRVEYLWCSCVECLGCYCVDYLGCSWLISYIQSGSDE